MRIDNDTINGKVNYYLEEGEWWCLCICMAVAFIALTMMLDRIAYTVYTPPEIRLKVLEMGVPK